MKIFIREDIVEKIYIISVILAFGLLFYANAEENPSPDGTVVNLGLGKSFYIPCGIALISSFYIKKTTDAFDFALYLLMAFSIISTFFNPPLSANFLEWTITRFVFAILCFKDLRNINPKLFVKYLTLATPIIVLPHYVLSNPFGYGAWRYAGFYGDPNFLALALNFIITICYFSFKLNEENIVRACAVVAILGAIPLILLGMSRGGLLGLSVVLIFIFSDIFLLHKGILLLIILVLIFLLWPVFVDMLELFDLIEDRFSEGSANSRIEGIESAINVLSNRPELIPFGIGPGNTVPMMSVYRQYGYICEYAIHNTFFAILFEMGIFCCLLYINLYFISFRLLMHFKLFPLVGLLLSSVLSLFTLPGAAFMPGWILLFFVSNHNIEELHGSKII